METVRCVDHLDLRFCRDIVLHGVVKILLGDRMLFSERGIAVFVELGLVLVRFGARQLRFGLLILRLSLLQLAVRLSKLSPRLVRRCLKGPRIDLEQQLALFDERAFRIVLREEVPSDLCPNGGVHHSVQGSDPLAVDRDFILLYRDDFDVGSRWLGRPR